MAKANEVNITDGIIAYSNFSGRPTKYNPEGGVRTVTFVLPADLAKDLISDGWKVREQLVDPESGETRFLMDCKFTFRTREGKLRNLKMFMVYDDNKLVQVTEDNVDVLDRSSITSADAVISAYHWEFGGKTGITPYISALYLKIQENPIEAKYRKMLEENDNFAPDDISDLPFKIE